MKVHIKNQSVQSVVVSGLNVKELMGSIEKMLAEGHVTEDTIIVIDTFDGYRHGIEKIVMENEALMISAKMDQES